MLHRLRTISLTLWFSGILVGCGINNQQIVPTTIVSVPTNTLGAPIVSFTPKFTATLPPSKTPIPSATPSPTDTEPPVPPSPTPTLSPTPVILGAVNFTSPTANLRSGPGQTFAVITGIKAGTQVIVLGVDSSNNWYNVRMLDGSHEGWLSISLVTVSNATAVPKFSTQEIVRQTADAGTQVAIGTSSADSGTQVALPKAGVIPKNGVLAYCDAKGEPHKTLPAGQPVLIWWSWFAKTADQIADHINYSTYEVRIDGQVLKDWRNYKSDVVQVAGRYYVYWYVPIGSPLPGEHKIEYKVSWQQQISDGDQTYGPGGKTEVDTGSCVFTVK